MWQGAEEHQNKSHSKTKGKTDRKSKNQIHETFLMLRCSY